MLAKGVRGVATYRTRQRGGGALGAGASARLMGANAVQSATAQRGAGAALLAGNRLSVAKVCVCKRRQEVRSGMTFQKY